MALVYWLAMTAIVARLGSDRARTLAGILALAGLAALYATTEKHVTLVVDGAPRTLSTHARTVQGVLREAGLVLGSNDRLNPAPGSAVHDEQIVELTTAGPVLVDGPAGQVRLMTVEVTPADILASAGLRLFPGDRLWVDGAPAELTESRPGPRPTRLRVVPGRQIAVVDGGTVTTIRSAAPSVGDALWEAGIFVFVGDRVEPAVHESLEGVDSITIGRSVPLSIRVDGSTIHTRATAATVGEALAEARVVLIGLDFTQPTLDEDVPASGEIRVVRVEERVEVEEKPLPFDTAFQPIEDLEIDNQKVIESGAYGVVANRVRVRIEDGQEIQRFVEGDWVARQPEPRVIGYGTQIIPRSINTDDGPIEYCRALTMYATSYSPSRAGVPPDAKNFGITASGKPLTRGLVAIDRSLIPFGTQMYVPGYGFAEAADTGGGVRNRWIDLGYDDDNYVAWHQYVTVYFLCPLPGMAWIIP